MNLKQIIEKIESGAYDKAFIKLYGEKAILAQRERYIKVCRGFISSFGDMEGTVLVSTPGRTEICGNHTDHNLGLVAAAGVNLDIIAAAAPSGDMKAHVDSSKYPCDIIDLSSTEMRQSELGRSGGLIRGCAAYLADKGYKIGGFFAYTDNQVLKGSGLSSSAAFEVEIGCILSVLFNESRIAPVTLAKAGQYAENKYYGKPCGLLDQTACAVGSFVALDFENPESPKVESIPLNLDKLGLELWVVDTGGNHADLTADYAAIPAEMFSVAKHFGKKALREVSFDSFIANLPALRSECGDRAILRAFHYYAENERVASLLKAVKENDLTAFIGAVNAGGRSSYMYNQNAYSSSNPTEQGISIAYALASSRLNDESNAFRLQGGGFAGTLQVFAKAGESAEFTALCEKVFGKGCCHRLSIRNCGATAIEELL